MEHMAHINFVVAHNEAASSQKQRVVTDRKTCGKNNSHQGMNSIYRASVDMKLCISHIIYLLQMINHNKQNPHIMV